MLGYWISRYGNEIWHFTLHVADRIPSLHGRYKHSGGPSSSCWGLCISRGYLFIAKCATGAPAWKNVFSVPKLKGDTLRGLGYEDTVYPKKYAHGFVVLCFVVVMQSFIMNSHEVFIRIHQGCFAGTGAIVRLPQCQWSKPDGYGKISQCITTTKHSKAKTVCIFLGIYCKTMSESMAVDKRFPSTSFWLATIRSPN